MFPLVSSLFLIGVGALCWGLRGRTVGNHPACRRCGYDLSGRPTGAQACSECGVELSRSNAIRVGIRRRRPLPVVAGLLLALPAGAWLLSPSVRAIGDRDWEPNKPTFWVIRDAGSPDSILEARAIHELMRRLDSGKLNDGQVRQLAAVLLRVQLKLPSEELDQIVRIAHTRGQLRDDQWQQYWIQALPYSLHAEISSDAPDQVQVWPRTDMRNWRWGGFSLPNFTVGVVARSLRIGRYSCPTSGLLWCATTCQDARMDTRTGLDFVPLSSGRSEATSSENLPVTATFDLVVYDLQTNALLAKVPVTLSTNIILPAGKTIAPAPPASRP